MKNTMKKSLSLLLVLLMTCMLLLPGCQQDPLVIETPDADPETNLIITQDHVIIKITQEALNGEADMTLMDYMETLKDGGELEFSVSDGMITSINGIENPADYSSCWMLYTSDEDNANKAWGTVEYEGKEYGSAISGAETLKIKADQLYIWVYKSFS